MSKLSNLFRLNNIIVFSIFILTIVSCSTTEENNNTSGLDENLKCYYDRKDNGNLQVYSYDGEQEVNLVNDFTHDYWWIKVSPDKTKFLYGVANGKNPDPLPFERLAYKIRAVSLLM